MEAMPGDLSGNEFGKAARMSEGDISTELVGGGRG